MAIVKEKGKWHKSLGELTGKLGKLRYPLLILLLGAILLMIPSGKSNTQSALVETEGTDTLDTLTIEETRLSTLLSQVRGAGRVEVMLSVAAGSETIYQSDVTEENKTGQDSQMRKETSAVLYGTGSGKEAALIKQKTAPIYQGAVVLCQGADDPGIKLALVQAVASLTGLGTDRITVIKMK